MGSVNIDNTGSGADVTLSSDGTDLLLDGTAIGGGGGSPDLLAENYDGTSTKPTATGTNAVAIGELSTASPDRGMAFGYSATASGTQSTAVGRGASAGGTLASAFGYAATTAASQAVAIGQSYSAGQDSLAAVIDSNSSSYGATGSNSVAMGRQAKATQLHSYAFGSSASATNTGSVVLGGTTCTSSGLYSTTIGGAYNAANGDYSVASGRYGNTNSIYGKRSHGTQLDLRLGEFSLGISTTDATASVLTTNGSSASTNNQVVLQNNSAYAFHGTIVARQQASGGTASAAWKIEGLIRREGSASTTVLVNSATTVLDNTPSWGMALSADTTNGGLAITVTGAASTNIRWVATIHTSEVTYA